MDHGRGRFIPEEDTQQVLWKRAGQKALPQCHRKTRNSEIAAGRACPLLVMNNAAKPPLPWRSIVYEILMSQTVVEGDRS